MLMRLALMMCCGSIATLPLTVQSTSTARAEDVRLQPDTEISSLPPAAAMPRMTISRDPFEPDVAALPITTDNTTIGTRVTQGEDISHTPLAKAQRLVVRAIVVGAHSRALVEAGGTVRVLGVGDHVGEATVTAIDSTGIVLSSGLKFPLLELHR